MGRATKRPICPNCKSHRTTEKFQAGRHLWVCMACHNVFSKPGQGRTEYNRQQRTAKRGAKG